MAKVRCSCGAVAKFSKSGHCLQCGKLAPVKYNQRPQEPQLPTTERGKRRNAHHSSRSK